MRPALLRESVHDHVSAPDGRHATAHTSRAAIKGDKDILAPVRNITDAAVQRLLSGETDGTHPNCDGADFEQALSERFRVDELEPASDARTLDEAQPHG